MNIQVPTLQIKVQTVELTKNILKQLDTIRDRHFQNPTTKPIARAETHDDCLVIFETTHKDSRGFETKEYTKSTYSIYWNTGIEQAMNNRFGIANLYAIPKIILLK